MKLEYAGETLGDDAVGDFILDGGGGHARVVEQTALAGGNAPATFARNNHSNTRVFIVQKQHTSLAVAKAWFNRHPDGLAESGVLRISEGGDADVMSDAALQNVERVELTGRSTALRYTFIGGRIIQGA